MSRAEAELAETRYRLENSQSVIAQQIRQLWANTEQQAAAREVARLELELSRRSVEVVLAQFEEGRSNRPRRRAGPHRGSRALGQFVPS